MISSYYQQAHGVILVYDISKRESFENLGYWQDLIEKKCEKSAKILLIGNKIDKENERQVSTTEGREYAEKNGYYFMETSAKTNVNEAVGKAFDMMIQHLGRIHIKIAEKENSKISNISRPTLPIQPIQSEKKGCC